MIKKEEFTLPSSDGISQLHAIRWIPDGRVRAVLQISHGMMDYMERYDEFARFLAEHQIAVYGHDHLGHGLTAGASERMGFFSYKEGHLCVIKDIHRLRKKAIADYKGLPYFMLGHSMGSFFLRKYLTVHGRGLAGALLLGTGGQPLLLVKAGRALSWWVTMLKGPGHRSFWLHQMVLGGFNLSFKPAKTPFDWLSRDEEKVELYGRDPMTQFWFTAQAYYDMFTVVESLYQKKQLARMPKQLPCIFMSGDKDPVGDFSLGAKRAFCQFQDAGMEQVTIKLYENGRHELLNETNRQQVFQDILSWLENLLP